MNKSNILSVLLVIVVLLAGSVGAVIAAGGTGPNDALTPSDDWQPIGPEESYWYGFEYKGDSSQIQVRLEVEPAGSVDFEVWTPGGIRRWGQGLESSAIGGGSPDPSSDRALVWSGNFVEAGTYYVVVEHNGSQPGTAYYLLDISGDGVSLEPAAAAPTATPQPTGPKPKPAAPSDPAGKLVFQTNMGGAIYSIHVDGSNLQRVTNGMEPAWSPDGSQIAVSRWSDPRGIWVMNADGSGERHIFDWSETRHPSWSPDGDQLVFSRQKGGTKGREFCWRGRCFTIPPREFWNLGIVSTADGALQEPLPNADTNQAPDWSPAGDRIVYDAVQGLRVDSIDGYLSYLITSEARDTGPKWSPDASKVAFTRWQHDHWEVYVVDADGRNVRRLTDTPAKANGQAANSVAPAWSPDGNYIAFLTDRTGKWEIWIMKANGTGQAPMFGSELKGIPLDYAYLGERVLDWAE
jgi:TolB protein